MPRVPPVTTATLPVRSKRSIPLWCHPDVVGRPGRLPVTEFEPADPAPPGVDPTVASPARVWNYWVGGTDNFAVDRETGERVRDAMPFMPMLARYARRFLADAVRQLAADHGVRQFLDIGTGMPTAGNTHQVAQEIAPGTRVVYVDNDPSVLAQAGAPLSSAPGGATAYLGADLRGAGRGAAPPGFGPADRGHVHRRAALHPRRRRPLAAGPAAAGRRAVRQLPGHRARGRRHRGLGHGRGHGPVQPTGRHPHQPP